MFGDFNFNVNATGSPDAGNGTQNLGIEACSSYPIHMNRLSLIPRSLAVASALILVAVSVAMPVRTTAPAAPIAFGCADPPIGGLVEVFDTCAECQFIGIEGTSQGVWTTWHCRAMFPGYYLYAT